MSMLGGFETEGDGKPVKVTYHDSCHMKRSLGVTEEQRELLRNTKGVELIEMEGCDKCLCSAALKPKAMENRLKLPIMILVT